MASIDVSVKVSIRVHLSLGNVDWSTLADFVVVGDAVLAIARYALCLLI